MPERHLGLIQAVEHPDLDKAIADYAAFVAEHVNLDRLFAVAASVSAPRPSGLVLPPPGQHIALARDEAFSFTYPHLLTHWRASGAELSFFSPLADECPDTHADVIWLPGGILNCMRPAGGG